MRRSMVVALAALGVFGAACALSFTATWDLVERRIFDLLTRLDAPQRSVLPITIVGIDEASFAQVARQWPWPRSLFASLVDRLHERGAAVIALDIVLNEASTPDEDDALAASIARAGNVVLAADHAYHETALFRQWLRVDPLPKFKQAGAVSGLATAELDRDGVVRRVPQHQDAFWRAVTEVLMRSRPGLIPAPRVGPDDLIRHLGPAHTFPYVSFYQVLADDPSIPREFFRDQIVFVGRDVRASPEAGAVHADMLATPFLASTRQLTPGVEIQATVVENAITGRTITPAAPIVRLAFAAAFMLLAFPAGVRWHPVWSATWMLLLGIGAAGSAYWAFSARDYWLPAGLAVGALATFYLTMASAFYLAERRQAQRVRFAFSRYLSPHVVARIVAQPEALRLGGERRNMTLLFCDLAGFTTISERLAPEQVAQLINTWLTAMTRVIHGHGGTVQKFLGDGIYAFWGAPLANPQHAQHACEAAIAMQAALEALGPQFANFGVRTPGMRIGLHTGDAIVGNMGSLERFDYTALGDAVNLAARLEGVNKLYGTRILLSGATAEQMNGSIRLRPIDWVRVKGKENAVFICTPCDDARLIELTERALDAYRRQDWPVARQAWQEVAAHAPGDAASEVFLERINELQSHPPETGWDGATALEKL
jgi:adenylate cyclase